MGNIKGDGNKGITITYNHLNLPKSITFPGGNSMTITYDAAGIKLKKQVSGSENYTLHYIGGIEYRQEANTKIESIYHAEGRVIFEKTEKEGDVARYQFNLKDHLGNVRVVFSDLNENGYLEPYNSDPNGKQLPADYIEIIQENHYYPFGLAMEGEWENLMNEPENKYLYNGKELNSDFGLDWSDYGARYYDAAIGRFSTIDPHAENYYNLSSYHYVHNNPLIFIDPTGMDGIYVNEKGEYKGQDANKEDKTVRVISDNDWKAAEKADDGSITPRSTANAISKSTSLTEYGEGISISDDAWSQVEADGGEKLEPTVENNSSDVAYYKPGNGENGNPLEPITNPGYDNGGSYPIEAGTDLYTPIDGVKTKKTGTGKVVRVPGGFNVEVKSNGIANIKGLPESLGAILPRKYQPGETKGPKHSSWDKLRNETRF